MTNENTYSKFAPNVFLAKCSSRHKKGDIVKVTTRYGKENDSIIFNEIYESDGFFFYSIVREDGFNFQEWAKRRAEKKFSVAENAKKKSDEYYEKSNMHKDFLGLGEPIKVGHHSEKRHRRIIEQSNSNMGKSIELRQKAEASEGRAAYYETKAQKMNESMPESIDYFEELLAKAIEEHQGLKNGSIPRTHSYSLTYAKKQVKQLEKKVSLVKRLWG